MENPPPDKKSDEVPPMVQPGVSPDKPPVTIDDVPPITIDSKALDVTTGAGSVQLKDPEKRKGDYANLIALVIVGTFSSVIVLTLIIAIGILWKSGDPNRVKLFTDAITPLFETTGKFIPTVFGSLMAFILGYYYSKEQRG